MRKPKFVEDITLKKLKSKKRKSKHPKKEVAPQHSPVGSLQYFYLLFTTTIHEKEFQKPFKNYKIIYYKFIDVKFLNSQ